MNIDRPADFSADAPIRNAHELYNVLDKLLQNADEAWWNSVFAERARPRPFFVDWPDESLVDDFRRGAIRPGRVLELGCGNGRNAIYMASRGCSVDAVDFAPAAITWATERARTAGEQIAYINTSIFDLEIVPAAYDIVYDSGCFHQLAPHRRDAYVNLVVTALKPGGVLSLVCFRPEGGSGLTDLQVYEQRTLGGGLGYSERSLRHIFASCFTVVEIRRMAEMLPSDEVFGKDFLWAVRMCKKGA